MPGVPFEMMEMMEVDVIPLLTSRFIMGFIDHRTLLTAGAGESLLADMIQAFEEALPLHIKLAYLPNFGMVRLRLSASGYNKDLLRNELDEKFTALQLLVKDYMVTNEDEPIEKVIGKLLKEKNKTLCTAESCTGGYIAHLITSQPGSSSYYNASIISYSYKAKEDLLDVNGETLLKEGAVSKAVVISMAIAGLKR